MAIQGKTVGFLVADETDTVEYEPIVRAMRQAGADCVIVAPDLESAKRICLADECPVQTGVSVETACGLWLDGLVIPGGKGVDAFLHVEEAMDLVQAHDAERKPIATIGRGILMLMAADLVDGRHASVPTEIARELEAVGGIATMSPTFKEGNWITGKGTPEVDMIAESLVCALESVPSKR